jgi:hypothetical protein
MLRSAKSCLERKRGAKETMKTSSLSRLASEVLTLDARLKSTEKPQRKELELLSLLFNQAKHVKDKPGSCMFRWEVSFKGFAKRSFIRFMGNKTFSLTVRFAEGLKPLKPFARRFRFKAFSAHLPASYADSFMQHQDKKR